MGHNSLSKELLAGSQKGEYCSAYSKSPGPGVFCICPTVQVFSNLWVGDFCVCVFLLGFFFFCVVEVVLSLFLFLSWMLAASSQAPRLELPDTVIQYLSYFFFPSGNSPTFTSQAKSHPEIVPCHIPQEFGILLFRRESESKCGIFLSRQTCNYFMCLPLKKSVTLIALISERLMCLWASDKLKEPPLMRAGMSKFRANLAFRDLTFLALSNRTSFPLLV